jgi:hypothetical protein
MARFRNDDSVAQKGSLVGTHLSIWTGDDFFKLNFGNFLWAIWSHHARTTDTLKFMWRLMAVREEANPKLLQ